MSYTVKQKRYWLNAADFTDYKYKLQYWGEALNVHHLNILLEYTLN